MSTFYLTVEEPTPECAESRFPAALFSGSTPSIPKGTDVSLVYSSGVSEHWIYQGTSCVYAVDGTVEHRHVFVR